MIFFLLNGLFSYNFPRNLVNDCYLQSYILKNFGLIAFVYIKFCDSYLEIDIFYTSNTC